MDEKTASATVSVIIPALNEEDRLPGCLCSLAALKWPAGDVEVIVVDNGSTDQTCAIARNMGARVIQEPSGTVARLRNIGAGAASGRVLAFVDADCTVPPDWLSSAAPYFDAEDISAWGSVPGIPEDATWVQRAWYLLRKKEARKTEVDWLESMNFFVRKSLFDRVGGFDESLVTCEDVDLSYRLKRFGPIVADAAIGMVHLGEARTLKAFVKKEFWRGQDSLKGVKGHGLTLNEIPSLAMIAYFSLGLPGLLIAMGVFRSPFWAMTALAGVLVPGLLVLFKIRHKTASPLLRFQLVCLGYVYFTVRAVAALRGLGS